LERVAPQEGLMTLGQEVKQARFVWARAALWPRA